MSDTILLRFNIIWEHFINDPKKWIRFLVLFVCSIVVFFQLSECFGKLSQIPITTHSHFRINETLTYPAITFCRTPAYKADVMKKYNLSSDIALTNAWKRFPYNTSNLDDFFQEVTYGPSEYFGMYSLNHDPDNIKVISSINFDSGQCQTFVPLISTRGSWKPYGYSVFLEHDAYANESSTVLNGWNLYIHEPKENFSENAMILSGRVENIFIGVEEDVEIKIEVQHFHMISNRDNKCIQDDDYSAIKNHELCKWEYVTAIANCTGPWMPSIKLPYCKNYQQMKELIKAYRQLSNTTHTFVECKVVEPCASIIYSTYIVNRIPFIHQEVPTSHIALYYTSKMVSIFEEVPAYDLSQFVADMGGTLGFLLGLSVLGLIGILERVAYLIFGGCIQKNINQSSKVKVNDSRGDETNKANQEKQQQQDNHSDCGSICNDNEITAECPPIIFKQKSNE